MNHKLHNLGRNIELVFADSREYEIAKYNYLPDRIMNCIRGNMSNLHKSSKNKIGKFRNWTTIQLTNQHCTILCIMMCRIPQGTTQGICNSIVQYNQSDTEIKNANQYWKESIEEIITYMESLQNIDDILLAGNLN